MNCTVRSASIALAVTLASAGARASLVVTEVMAQASAGTSSSINGDWWELTNGGTQPVTLSGYQWADTEDQLGGATPQPTFFPALTINPGQSIIILEEAAASEAEWRANWNAPDSLIILATDEMIPSPGVTDTFSGLGSGGDAVYLYDAAGTPVSSFAFGGVTRGTSFEQDIFGGDLGLSLVGEHGALRAANGDVGSPGVAVPAPGACALLGLALMTSRRRGGR